MQNLGQWITILISFLGLLTTIILFFLKWLSTKFDKLEMDNRVKVKEMEQKYIRTLNEFKGGLAIGHKEQEGKIHDLTIGSLENQRRIESIGKEMLYHKEITGEKINAITNSIDNLLNRFEAGFHEVSAALKENTSEVQKLTIKLTAHIAESEGRHNAKS